MLKLPSGALFVVGEMKGHVALFPIPRDVETPLKNLLGFDTEEDAKRWIGDAVNKTKSNQKLIANLKPVKVSHINDQHHH